MYVNSKGITEDVICPKDAGLRTWPRENVVANDLETATLFVREALFESRVGAPRDMILLNSAVALCLSGLAGGLVEGVMMGAEAIDSGRVQGLVEKWSLASKE